MNQRRKAAALKYELNLDAPIVTAAGMGVIADKILEKAEEKMAREKLLKEMMEAEEARRKKLLEDVANSLQGSDSTNMTSGADELLEYEMEGVLD